jgi:hypothetical protein
MTHSGEVNPSVEAFCDWHISVGSETGAAPSLAGNDGGCFGGIRSPDLVATGE